MRQGHAEKTSFRPKTNVEAKGMHPGAVSQIGEVVGKNPDHAMMKGNPDVHVVAAEEGPGCGRTIYGRGTQAKHGED